MSFQRWATWMVVATAIALATSRPVSADEREHFQLKLGPSYDQGDFGTSDTTRTIFVPLTFKYLGEHFDIGLTVSYVHVETATGVTLVEGTPTRTGQSTSTSAGGFGDMVLKGRYFILDDPGPSSPLPSLTPFVKVKFPTADEKKNLGTGEYDYGFGLEWDKRFGSFFIFGDVSYTIIGDPPGQDFRNRPAASLGAGYRISDLWTVFSWVEWRRALATGPDPVDLVGVVSYKITPTLTISPNVTVGLTNGSPDWGVGVELSYKFGRW